MMIRTASTGLTTTKPSPLINASNDNKDIMDAPHDHDLLLNTFNDEDGLNVPHDDNYRRSTAIINFQTGRTPSTTYKTHPCLLKMLAATDALQVN
ncbi:hypothetical protein Hypma_005707 [Hypsizygus marmoreus]|uniref:Uncharacterized protein n=1 Tax=Hypsizygus marmoreus TaxID=39966 RepID=A0A369K7N7_HYPMA|nr:hypothetical protein Hypma_005707 [Hypsizygus marmoreus]